VRFGGVCYRAHDPRWSFKPTSGAGASIRGARFNPKGVPALYLALTVMGAVKEANQGFARRLDPCVLCSYDVDCEDVADLTTERSRKSHRVRLADLECAWMTALAEGKRPQSWAVHDRLKAAGHAGILVPSFAPGATPDNQNLVLWRWGSRRSHRVKVIDPSGRLPRNQLSWT
jgi:RES domain-containing protein